MKKAEAEAAKRRERRRNAVIEAEEEAVKIVREEAKKLGEEKYQ